MEGVCAGSWWDLFDVPDLSGFLQLDEGCAGVLIAGLLALLVAGLLIALAFVFAQLGIDPFAVLGGALGWVVYRGFRRVFLVGRRGCKGNLGSSVLHAASFTLLYTGWGFLLVEVLRKV